MVLTINSRGYLCLNHPPVIISTDLIFLFSFSSLQSWAGKTRLQDGDVLMTDSQYLKTLDMDIYIWILVIDNTPEEIWGCWFVCFLFFFCKKYWWSKGFGEKRFLWVFLLSNNTSNVKKMEFNLKKRYCISLVIRETLLKLSKLYWYSCRHTSNS